MHFKGSFQIQHEQQYDHIETWNAYMWLSHHVHVFDDTDQGRDGAAIP